MSTVNQVMKKLKSKGNPQRRELFKRHTARSRPPAAPVILNHEGVGEMR